MIAPYNSHGTPLECIDELRSFLLTLHCSAVRRFAYRNCVGIDNMDSAPCPDGWRISIALIIHSLDPSLFARLVSSGVREAIVVLPQTTSKGRRIRRDSEIAPTISIGWCAVRTLQVPAHKEMVGSAHPTKMAGAASIWELYRRIFYRGRYSVV